MIFLTVGSFFFDELVKAVDVAVAEGRLSRKVVMQIGHGGYYQPVHCEFFRTSPGLDSYYQRCDLVVAHGGVGTTFEVLEHGLRLVSVCNANLSDNHQNEFLEGLERRGMLTYCRSLSDLPNIIENSLLKPPPPLVDPCMFFTKVADDLDRWRGECKSRRDINSSWRRVLQLMAPSKINFLGM